MQRIYGFTSWPERARDFADKLNKAGIETRVDRDDITFLSDQSFEELTPRVRQIVGVDIFLWAKSYLPSPPKRKYQGRKA